MSERKWTALLQPSEISGSWQAIAPLISAAIERSHGGYVLGDIFLLLVHGEMQCWAGIVDDKITTVVISRLTNYPQVRYFTIVFMSGKGAGEWIHDHFDTLLDWAKHMGCKQAQVLNARKGWIKMLPDWDVTGVCLRKKL